MFFWSLVLGFILASLSLVAWSVFKWQKLPCLTSSQLHNIEKDIQSASKLAPEHAILELHKILITTLNDLYQRSDTASSILRLAEQRFGDPAAVWALHRLRNRLAHEKKVTASTQQARFFIVLVGQVLQKMSR